MDTTNREYRLFLEVTTGESRHYPETYDNLNAAVEVGRRLSDRCHQVTIEVRSAGETLYALHL